MRKERDENWLNQKAIIEGLKDYEMADLAGCNESTIQKWRYTYGIYRRKKNKTRGIIHRPQALLCSNERVRALTAGFNNGDGHIGISKVKRRRSSRYSYSLHMIFTQSRIDKMQLLKEIQKYYGGFIFPYKKKRMITCYQLRLSTWDSYRLLKDLEFLISKYPNLNAPRKKQIKLAFRFAELKERKQGLDYNAKESEVILVEMEKCKQKMHWYNRRGTSESRKYSGRSRVYQPKKIEQIDLGGMIR